MRRRRARGQLKLITAPWRGPISALSAVIFAGALGYRITEGWDWGDCLWMVLITISTIGFGEVAPLSPPGRLVTVLIVVGGLVGCATGHPTRSRAEGVGIFPQTAGSSAFSACWKAFTTT